MIQVMSKSGIQLGNFPFAHELMGQAVQILNEQIKSDGRYYPTAMEGVANAVVRLRFDDLIEELQRTFRIAKVPWWKFILNHGEFLARKQNEQKWLRFPTIQDAVSSHPVIDEEYYKSKIDKHSENDFVKAFDSAQFPYDQECVLLTQIMFGEIEEALEQRKKIVDEGRSTDVFFVAVIEAFRQGDIALGKNLYDEYQRKNSPEYFGDEITICKWMALGICGYAPWAVYPYPDF